MPPFTPPTPQQINDAINQVTSVVASVATQLGPVGTAVQDANTTIVQTGQAFTDSVNNGLKGIQTAINTAHAALQAQGNVALNALHNLQGILPGNPTSLILINGQELAPDPELFYTTMRSLIDNRPASAITIELHGPLAAPLMPLLVADQHAALRAIVLPAFGLPMNSKVLNSDPVTITALIVICLIVLGLPLSVALGIAIAALFLALAAVLIISAIQGRPIEVTTCPNVTIGGTVVGAGSVGIPVTLCTTVKIGMPTK
jgi:hypothetical protein